MNKNWNWTKSDNKNSANPLRSLAAQSSEALNNLPATPASYFGSLGQFYQNMDRVLEEGLRNFGLPSIFNVNAMPALMFTPRVDIASTGREYTITVETPGIDEKDIRIDVSRAGELCICGEKRLENDNQNKDFHRIERAYGSFSRTLALPEDADKDNIEASFNNGILTITAPKLESQQAEPRRIEVNAGESRRNVKQSPRQDNMAANSANNQPKRAA